MQQPTAAAATRTRNRVWAGLVVLCATLAILAFLEMAARAIAARSPDPLFRSVAANYRALARNDLAHFRFSPDRDLPYRLTPNYVFHPSGRKAETRHNASGFRSDREFGPKRPNVLRIVCIGGSTTYGAGVDDNGAAYPSQLEGLLNGDLRPEPWTAVEVFNLGVGGYTSAEDLPNLRLHGLPLDPDVVLIQSGLNDVTPRLYAGFRCDYGHYRRKMAPLAPGLLERQLYRSQLFVSLAYGAGWLDPLTLQARAQYPMPTGTEALANLEKNGTECFRRNLETMVDLCQAAGAKVWLLTHPYFDASQFRAPDPEDRLIDKAYMSGTLQHNAVIREVAAEKNVQVIDAATATPHLNPYYTDPVHMSEQGNLLKAKMVAQEMVRALEADSGRRSPGF